MQVVGITSQQEVYVASKERRFKINEILIILDRFQGNQTGEVIETNSYNRYVPMALNSELVDKDVLKSLEVLGYKVDDDTIHVAKVRLIVEAEYPIQTAAEVRAPKFEEVQNLLIKTEPKRGLVFGTIKSTSEMINDLPDMLLDISPLNKNGQVVKQDGVPFIFDIYKMNQYPHIGIFGGSGSGKSFGLRVILEELMKLNIPSIVLDPHYEMNFSELEKIEEYKNMKFDNRFQCFQVGYDVGVNFTDLNTHDLKNLLNTSSNLTDAMISAIDRIHKRKDSYESFSNKIELLKEGLSEGKNCTKVIGERLNAASERYERERLQEQINLLNEYNDYQYETINGVSWRLSTLYNQGIFSKDIAPIESGLMLGKSVIIQGSSKLLQVFSTYLLGNLYKKRREYGDAKHKKIEGEYFPPFIIVTDEAHNFAPKGYESPSKSILKEIAQEGRKYGVYLIFATQRPTLLDETITAQLNTKMVFRTVRASDIGTIKEETDITAEEAKRLPYLQSGDAFVSSAILGRTVAIRVRAAATKSPHTENPFLELENRVQVEQDKILELVLDKMPFFDAQINEILSRLERENGVRMSYKEMINKLENLCDGGKIKKKKVPIGTQYYAG